MGGGGIVKTHITSHHPVVWRDRNNDNYGGHDLLVYAERTITQHAIVIQPARRRGTIEITNMHMGENRYRL